MSGKALAAGSLHLLRPYSSQPIFIVLKMQIKLYVLQARRKRRPKASQ